ncbi:MAG: hypothetical protein ACK56Q_07715, partial [Pirellulaceae bacterium]
AVSAMHIAQSLGPSRFKTLQTASRTPVGSQPLGCECQQKTQKVGGTNWGGELAKEGVELSAT